MNTIILLVFAVFLFSDSCDMDKSLLQIKWMDIPAGPFLFTTLNDTSIISYNYKISEAEITNGQYLNFLNQALAYEEISIKGNRVIGYYAGDETWKKGNYTFLYFKDNLDNRSIFRFISDNFSLVNDTLWHQHPVKYVTWFGAFAFANFYGLRLPTNMEWEKAVRGMSKSNYPWGDYLQSENANYFNSKDPFDNGTTPVNYFNGVRHNDFKTTCHSSYYGVNDMIGNVSEWTNSSSENHPNLKIYRGGSWRNNKSDFSIYLLGEAGPKLATAYIGFRCVK